MSFENRQRSQPPKRVPSWSILFTAVFAPVLTLLILVVLRAVFGELRATDEGEAEALDLSEHSESAQLHLRTCRTPAAPSR